MRRTNGSTFGECLEQAILRNPKLTRVEVNRAEASKALGIGISTLDYWLHNRSTPDLKKLPDIAQAIGCKAEDLLPTR